MGENQGMPGELRSLSLSLAFARMLRAVGGERDLLYELRERGVAGFLP